MKRKTLKPWEQYEADRRRREWAAPKLAELYPNVEEVRLDLRLTPHDGPGDLTPRDRLEVIKPDQRAFFEIPCSDWECICGGFDLSEAVGKAVREGAANAEGHLTCEGWQDTVRYQRHRCMMSLDYRVRVMYREAHTAEL